MTDNSAESPPTTAAIPVTVVTLALLDSASTQRDARRADLDWQPKDDRSCRATIAGIAPPGSATPAIGRSCHRAAAGSAVRLLSSKPRATESARIRIALRLVAIAIIATAYVYWAT